MKKLKQKTRKGIWMGRCNKRETCGGYCYHKSFHRVHKEWCSVHDKLEQCTDSVCTVMVPKKRYDRWLGEIQ